MRIIIIDRDYISDHNSDIQYCMIRHDDTNHVDNDINNNTNHNNNVNNNSNTHNNND